MGKQLNILTMVHPRTTVRLKRATKDESKVVLSISLRHLEPTDGKVELEMNEAAASRLIYALQAAVNKT
jgi:hypothetical protein